MKLKLENNSYLNSYKSNSQKARVFSERWVSAEMYCPLCLNKKINTYINNKEVADFFCPFCANRYQLKASSNKLGKKIIDGEYNTFIWHVKKKLAPNFLLMQYSNEDWCVNNLFIIPKYFISTELIEKRKPLSITARRKGWVGCNILIHSIPDEAKIPIIYAREIQDKEIVNKKLKKFSFLEDEKNTQISWIMDVLYCIEKIKKDTFDLKDIYKFKNYLKKLHPNNNYIEEKIRQQLQILRDKKIIRSIERGRYSKTDH